MDLPSIAEVGRALRTGTITSVALAEACLARIAATDAALNAFVLATAERAIADAMRADAELSAGLCGRPLGCKGKNEKSDARVDCDHVSGLLTRRQDRWPRWGSRSSPKQ